ncbi:hypothetical protein EVAR_75402_1 [Eumeta japonica]|uniref:Uncharacterized protein n=1 Tax=Eumeta variegata TaxID=151549 RepID=A0A4C1TMG6_EUMVA|nr:hypothetical protein EVAR_75402_1 [Eumeta japonica]
MLKYLQASISNSTNSTADLSRSFGKFRVISLKHLTLLRVEPVIVCKAGLSCGFEITRTIWDPELDKPKNLIRKNFGRGIVRLLFIQVHGEILSCGARRSFGAATKNSMRTPRPNVESARGDRRHRNYAHGVICANIMNVAPISTARRTSDPPAQ